MKRISFWYEFDDEDEDNKVSDYEIHFEIENKNDSISLDEVCAGFTKFLAAAGFQTYGLSEYFND